MKHGQQNLFSRQHRANYLRVFSLLFAGCVLVNLYVFLPKLREMYQENQQLLQAETAASVPTGPDGTVDSDKKDEEPSAEELLEAWRNKRNTVGTPADAGPDDAADADAEKFNNLRIIRTLPQTEAEIRQAHENARRLDCELIPAGEPVTLNDYKRFLTPWDSSAANAAANALYTRREIVSIGFDMRDADRKQLPALSSNEIMKFLQSSYVSVQVRVEKDPLDGLEFLHPRPLATLAEFRGSRLTAPPREALANSLKNYRGLGMYLSSGETPSNESMRTLVLVHKSERKESDLSGLSRIEPHYEFIFVRASPDPDKKLVLHTFVTSENRTQLHQLRESRPPAAPRLCTIQTMLAFTKFDFSGLNPTESVTTGSIVDDRAKYSLEKLNEFAASRGLTGTALENLPVILDAIINREITQ